MYATIFWETLHMNFISPKFNPRTATKPLYTSWSTVSYSGYHTHRRAHLHSISRTTARGYCVGGVKEKISENLPSTADNRILSSIVEGLKTKKVVNLDFETRASVALILRMKADEQLHQPVDCTQSDAEIVSDFLQTSLAKQGTLELLYMKRTANPGDTWSGHVSFPGGRQQASDADDLETAVREVWEEVGLSLSSTTYPTRKGATHYETGKGDAKFVLLGRLCDRQIFGGGKAVKGFAMSQFVFLQVSGGDTHFTLHEKEVNAVLWAPVDALNLRAVQYRDILLPYRVLSLQSYLPDYLNRLVGLDMMRFPSIALHKLPGAEIVHNRVLQEGESNEAFTLWGMTLRATGVILQFAGHPRLDWPPALVDNHILNLVIRVWASTIARFRPDIVKTWWN